MKTFTELQIQWALHQAYEHKQYDDVTAADMVAEVEYWLDQIKEVQSERNPHL